MDFDVNEILLNLIADYPRVSCAWLASSLGMSRSAIHRRLSNLRQAGFLVAYLYGAYTNYVLLYQLCGDKLPQFADESVSEK